jgi:hypothetical protein
MPGTSTSAVDYGSAIAEAVAVTDETLTVSLRDGRTISVPTAWYPRLMHATPAQRRAWRLIGRGTGIHWPDVEEDISVAGLLAGSRSRESRESLARWLAGRRSRPAASKPQAKTRR